MFPMKKKMEGGDEKEIAAKKKAVMAMRNKLGSDLGERLGELKKVTVAAPNKEGLEKGLEAAEEVVESAPGMEDYEQDPLMELASDMGVDELDAAIQKLEELKAEKMANAGDVASMG